MLNEKTPLQRIQEKAADELLLSGHDINARGRLNAILVEAFDAGRRAQRELDAELARINATGH